MVAAFSGGIELLNTDANVQFMGMNSFIAARHSHDSYMTSEPPSSRSSDSSSLAVDALTEDLTPTVSGNPDSPTYLSLAAVCQYDGPELTGQKSNGNFTQAALQTPEFLQALPSTVMSSSSFSYQQLEGKHVDQQSSFQTGPHLDLRSSLETREKSLIMGATPSRASLQNQSEWPPHAIAAYHRERPQSRPTGRTTPHQDPPSSYTPPRTAPAGISRSLPFRPITDSEREPPRFKIATISRVQRSGLTGCQIRTRHTEGQIATIGPAGYRDWYPSRQVDLSSSTSIQSLMTTTRIATPLSRTAPNKDDVNYDQTNQMGNLTTREEKSDTKLYSQSTYRALETQTGSNSWGLSTDPEGSTTAIKKPPFLKVIISEEESAAPQRLGESATTPSPWQMTSPGPTSAHMSPAWKATSPSGAYTPASPTRISQFKLWLEKDKSQRDHALAQQRKIILEGPSASGSSHPWILPRPRNILNDQSAPGGTPGCLIPVIPHIGSRHGTPNIVSTPNPKENHTPRDPVRGRGRLGGYSSDKDALLNVYYKATHPVWTVVSEDSRRVLPETLRKGLHSTTTFY